MSNRIYFLLSVILFITSSCTSLFIKLKAKDDIAKNVFVFENEQGKRLVYLAMTHLGKDGYFESVKTRVDSLRNEAYLVLYEGVGPSKNDTVLRKFRKVAGFHLTQYQDTENESMKMPSFVSKYEEQSMDNTGINYKLDISADYDLDSLVYVYEEKYKTIELSQCDWDTALTAKYKCKDTVKHSEYYMINTLRDLKVINLVEQYQNENIVLVYGKSHYFGLLHRFRKLGYELVEGKYRHF